MPTPTYTYVESYAYIKQIMSTPGVIAGLFQK